MPSSAWSTPLIVISVAAKNNPPRAQARAVLVSMAEPPLPVAGTFQADPNANRSRTCAFCVFGTHDPMLTARPAPGGAEGDRLAGRREVDRRLVDHGVAQGELHREVDRRVRVAMEGIRQLG